MGASVSGSESSEANQEHVMALRKSRGWNDDELIVMYSGNMGLGHLFDEVSFGSIRG